jgi:hypothetical protein
LEIEGFVVVDGADVPDPVSADTLAELDRKLDGADVMLVLKLHPGDIKNRNTWPEYRNIRVFSDLDFRVKGLNVYKLLACADAMITDFSSVAIDFLTVRKPLGVFATDRDFYVRGFTSGVMEKFDSVCYKLNSIDEVAAFVRDLPPAQPETAEINDLHRQDLQTPSRDILLAVGLEALGGVKSGPGAAQ